MPATGQGPGARPGPSRSRPPARPMSTGYSSQAEERWGYEGVQSRGRRGGARAGNNGARAMCVRHTSQAFIISNRGVGAGRGHELRSRGLLAYAVGGGGLEGSDRGRL